MNKFYLTSLLGTVLVLPNVALAATDGTLGATSTGGVGITLEIEQDAVIQVTGLGDFYLGSLEEGSLSEASFTDNEVCIFTAGAQTYSLEISSLNNPDSNGVGHMSDGDAKTVEYSWRFDDNDGHVLEDNNTQSGLTAADEAGCASGGAASMAITVDGAPLAVDSFTPFSDTITLTVAPE